MSKRNVIALVFIVVVVSAAAGYFVFAPGQEAPSPGEELPPSGVAVEVTETAPSELNDPDIMDTGWVWLDLIENAQSTIDIEAYYLGSADPPWILDNIYDAIVEAANRGVSVRVLTDSSMIGEEMVGELSQHENIEILPWDGGEVLHSKYMIVDGGVVSVGSTNVSYPAMAVRGTGNRELNLTLGGEEIVETYTYIFEVGWTEAGGESTGAEYSWEENWLIPVADGVEGVTSTIDAYSWLFDRAEEEVFFYVYVYAGAPSKLAAAIEEALERGVTVRALVDDGSETDYPQQLEQLEELGAEVRVIHLMRAAHPKLIISDGQWAYVGSANIHPVWMLSGREVGALVSSEDVSADLMDIFWMDWMHAHGLGA